MPSVRRAAVITHGRDGVGAALDRLRTVAESSGVTLVDGDDADIAIVLGGDGSMLRTLGRFLGRGVPVIGVNYGRVGFLTAMSGADLEAGIARVFAGEYRTVELSTLEVSVGGRTEVAVNDVVVAGGTLGRMVELGYAIGGEDLGSRPCDGLICATPTGSTAYNLSNGGPVLVWGLDAMVLTFVAPHALDIRPLVVPRGLGSLLHRQGFRDVHELAVGEGIEIGAVRVEATFAAHDGSRPPYPARAPAVGYAVLGSRRVYFAGDTNLFPEMDGLVPDLDLALIPIWGWGPSLGRGEHLDPEGAAEAIALLHPATAVPIHWGTYAPLYLGLRAVPAYLAEPQAAFSAAAARLAPGVAVRILPPGEALEL